MSTSKTIDIPVEVRDDLRKFRFSRLKGISVLIVKINKQTLSLETQERLEDISLEELADENAPRYVVISYPVKHPDGRIAVPLALINWKPTTSSPEMNTLHASTYPSNAAPQMQLLSKYIGSHGVDSVLFGEILRSFISENTGAEWQPDEPAIYNGIEDAREKCTKWLEDLNTRVSVGEIQREEERELRLATNPQLIAHEKQLQEEALYAAELEQQQQGLPDGLEIITTPSVTYTKSTFAGHCVRITSPDQVPLILNHLQTDRKIARATHPVINAWRCKTPDGVQHQDNDDDGESAAGNRIAHLLSILDVNNVLVVVTRWYGGVHLGADRFKYINQVAREAMDLAGVLNDDDEMNGKKAKEISRKKK
ncbi:UPF0029-domain-containing protein [Wallemia mellicola]|uniref:UPF0029-domain-containing protein n=1 Tax=Wallemia mellicola TaxID=1708541 RepID=A0A4T0MPB6_9BASI|nr:hypothetical protein E3Q24_04209 [Wallemia mellicola]TIB82570.1 UPF0029-domain-containing protein [Wallemia mellicola]TIB85291.1 UPF0029-domain-containing protein [Wallemia mellicola]TIC19420.1 UPF0029-domain-containing protein [Wallemia mellicola]TIC30532.1 UPF0029-domain-containing protein [Wallemia mellicola]